MWSADVFTRACSRDRRMMPPPEIEEVRQLDHPCEIGPDSVRAKVFEPCTDMMRLVLKTGQQ